MKSKIIITIKNFQKKIPVHPKKIQASALKALSAERFNKNAQICVSFVNDAKIRALNKRFLGHDYSTDVLAFDLSDKINNQLLIADIVISSDTAIRNAKRFSTTPRLELALYLTHGILHLLGYDDHAPQKTKKMRQREAELCPSIKRKP